jgi:hypothetical protein
MAISPNKGILKKISDILGFKVDGKKWERDAVIDEKIKYTTITRFPCLRELVGTLLPTPLTALLEKTANIGEVILIKILRENNMLGHFALCMKNGERFDKDAIAEVYTRQLGMVISRKRAEEIFFI